MKLTNTKCIKKKETRNNKREWRGHRPKLHQELQIRKLGIPNLFLTKLSFTKLGTLYQEARDDRELPTLARMSAT
jgi:hypothetical protein